MARVSYRASAPGSLMLLGEHAVLHGKRALVCAVNRSIRVALTPRKDRQVHIDSSLGHLSLDLDRIEMKDPFLFVISAIAQRKEHLKSGFDLKIESDFSHQVGLGSSAAVTVATSAALSAWLGERLDRQRLFNNAVLVVRETQGLGSGADIAASTFGGVINYCAEPLDIQKLTNTHPLTVIYSGSKKPTAEVVKLVEGARTIHPVIFEAIFRVMDRCVQNAAAAVWREDWRTLGGLFNINHGLMEAIGVSNAVLSEIVYALRADPGILGAKISGSGLGDCVIGLGQAQRKEWPYAVVPVEISPNGVTVS
ncbi:MAG: mevalonate kinase [Verrucomicrobiota bacterium]